MAEAAPIHTEEEKVSAEEEVDIHYTYDMRIHDTMVDVYRFMNTDEIDGSVGSMSEGDINKLIEAGKKANVPLTMMAMAHIEDNKGEGDWETMIGAAGGIEFPMDVPDSSPFISVALDATMPVLAGSLDVIVSATRHIVRFQVPMKYIIPCVHDTSIPESEVLLLLPNDKSLRDYYHSHVDNIYRGKNMDVVREEIFKKTGITEFGILYKGDVISTFFKRKSMGGGVRDLYDKYIESRKKYTDLKNK